MKLNEIERISIVGAGLMGHGIAQSFIMGGYPVMLYDVESSILETSKSHIEEGLKLFQEAGLIDKSDIEPTMKRLTTTLNLGAAVENADFITEAAPEDLPLKQNLFQEIEGLCREKTIIASNTSSLTLRDIGEKVQNKERLVTTHWFNPPHLVPTVEVVRGDETSDETLDTAHDLLAKIKKVPVKIQKELPGFLVNRIQIAMVREVLDLCEKGVASPEDIDKAVKGSMGFRLASIGPLHTIDLAGVKLWLRVCENLLPQIRSSRDAPGVLQNLAGEGHDGIKSGKGFYDYSVGFSEEGLDESVQKRDREFLNRLKNLYWD